MDEKHLPIAVHEEFARRMENEHERQNQRIQKLEDNVEGIGRLIASVQSLAKSVEQLAKAQEKQGKRLETLEQKPAKRWEALVDKALWAIAGALFAYVLSQVGL